MEKTHPPYGVDLGRIGKVDIYAKIFFTLSSVAEGSGGCKEN